MCSETLRMIGKHQKTTFKVTEWIKFCSILDYILCNIKKTIIFTFTAAKNIYNGEFNGRVKYIIGKKIII